MPLPFLSVRQRKPFHSSTSPPARVRLRDYPTDQAPSPKHATQTRFAPASLFASPVPLTHLRGLLHSFHPQCGRAQQRRLPAHHLLCHLIIDRQLRKLRFGYASTPARKPLRDARTHLDLAEAEAVTEHFHQLATTELPL